MQEVGMNRFNTLMAATFLSAAMLVSPAVQAMEIQQFDKMAVSDQSDYIAALIEGAQKVLIANGQNDVAAKVHKIFTEVAPGNKIPTGMEEFETYLAHVRVLDAERYVKDHAATRLEVEHAMILTLKRNGIVLPPAFMHVADNFHPKFPPRTLTADARPIDPPLAPQ
jgi:hypothetical protein